MESRRKFLGRRYCGLRIMWLPVGVYPLWAYVTACNPGSMPLSDRENVQRQGAPEQAVSEEGFVFFRGARVGDDGQWPPS